jgi:N-acetylmuramoyl-L-alanine amidase
MKVGVILGDNSAEKDKKSANDLKSFLLGEKFVFDIFKKFPKDKGIDLQIVRRTDIKNISAMVNGNGFDFSFAIQCINSVIERKGIRVRYLNGSTRGREIASIFQKNLVSSSGFPDLSVVTTTDRERDGRAMSEMEAPCVIAEPFPPALEESEIQYFVRKYDQIVDSYVQSLIQIQQAYFPEKN